MPILVQLQYRLKFVNSELTAEVYLHEIDKLCLYNLRLVNILCVLV